ncbi:hypothetical protein [Planococcus maritimus]|uniref:hypothetical protein n=1 Tax=Planococcus maritimus TaxID=192421 RepID=UPI00232EE6EE|nr:hypothetical protein [Planococcus maritimus]
MDNNNNQTDKDREQEYMKTSEQELNNKPHTEKKGLEEPKKTGYPPLQLGLIVFGIAVLVIVGFAIGFDWFGLFGN